MKEYVYKATKISAIEFDIELEVNWPTDSGSKAITLSDDEDVEVMFSAVKKSIELYVGKVAKENLQEHVQSPIVSTGLGHFTEMLETDNPSASLGSPTYSNPYVHAEGHGHPPINYGFMHYMMSQPTPEQYFPYYTTYDASKVLNLTLEFIFKLQLLILSSNTFSFQQQMHLQNVCAGQQNFHLPQPLYPTPSEMYDISQRFV